MFNIYQNQNFPIKFNIIYVGVCCDNDEGCNDLGFATRSSNTDFYIYATVETGCMIIATGI